MAAAETTPTPTSAKGAAGPQPAGNSNSARTDGTAANRMDRSLTGNGKQTVGSPARSSPLQPEPGSGLSSPDKPARFAPTPGRRYVPPPLREHENHVVDIFDEVEEELREERMQQLLKKYGGVLFAAALLLIGAVAGWKAWGWYQERRDMGAATLYLAASAKAASAGVAGPNHPEAIAAFQLAAASAPDGYRVLARLRQAALMADAGDLPGASVLWDQVSADNSADSLLRDLANLTWCIYHADKGDPGLLEGRLKPLATPGNAWRPLAMEQLALLDLRQGHAEAAKTELKKLAHDATAPIGVRNRANALLNQAGG